MSGCDWVAERGPCPQCDGHGFRWFSGPSHTEGLSLYVCRLCNGAGEIDYEGPASSAPSEQRAK